jgi:hypothetical protein
MGQTDRGIDRGPCPCASVTKQSPAERYDGYVDDWDHAHHWHDGYVDDWDHAYHWHDGYVDDWDHDSNFDHSNNDNDFDHFNDDHDPSTAWIVQTIAALLTFGQV